MQTSTIVLIVVGVLVLVVVLAAAGYLLLRRSPTNTTNKSSNNTAPSSGTPGTQGTPSTQNSPAASAPTGTTTSAPSTSVTPGTPTTGTNAYGAPVPTAPGTTDVSTNAPTGTSAPATAPATAPAAAPATIIPSNDAPLVGTTKVYYIRSAAAGPCPRTLQVPLCVAGDLSVVMSNGTGSREWWYFVPVANKPNTYYIRSWDRAFFQPSCWGYLSTVPCASGPFAGVFWEKNVLEEWVATPVPGKAQTFTLQCLARNQCNLTYLGSRNCPDTTLEMAAADDGSGRQHWIIQPV